MPEEQTDSVLSAIPELLQRNGVNLSQYGSTARAVHNKLKDVYAEFPERVAFGPKDHHDEIAMSCYQFVEPIKEFTYGVLDAFEETLKVLGGDVGTVGGVLGSADAGATGAAKSGPAGGHRA